GLENDPPVVFINPVIEWLSDEIDNSDEGCLSFPGIYVPIKRSLRARVRATGLDGNEFVAEGEGLYARAMQHEHDHLINKLLIDYVGPIKRQIIKRKMEKMTDEEADELQALGALAAEMLPEMRKRWPQAQITIELRKLHPPCPGNPAYTAVRLSDAS